MSVAWHAIIAEALRTADVVALRSVVATYLGRSPTRAEITAARKAAHRHVDAGRAQIVRVDAMTQSGSRPIMLLARPTADLSDPGRLTAIAADQPPPTARGKHVRHVPQRTESVVASIARSARSAQALDIQQLEVDHAAALERELAAALPHLEWLRRRLEGRGKS